MDCLCIAAEADPTGYVLVNGRTPTTTDLARLTGEPEAAVQSALEELERNGVFSRDRNGRIYNRRLVRDARRIANNRKNGKLGGNPKLLAENVNPVSVNPPDNPPDKAKKLEAREVSKSSVEDKESSTGAEAPKPDLVVVASRDVPAPPKPVPVDPKKQLYDLGKSALGPGYGGQITRLLKHHDGDVAAALYTMRQVAEAAGPPEYLGKILGRQVPTPEKLEWWELRERREAAEAAANG